MRRLAAMILSGFLAGCTTMPSDRDETFVAVASSLDHATDPVTIEDYILALPPFEFHEETVAQFTERVRNARKMEPRNFGNDRDSLFVNGDGSAPSKVFTLDRKRQMLTILSLNWEPGTAEDSITMRRVPGGWMRGPRIERKKVRE